MTNPSDTQPPDTLTLYTDKSWDTATLAELLTAIQAMYDVIQAAIAVHRPDVDPDDISSVAESLEREVNPIDWGYADAADSSADWQRARRYPIEVAARSIELHQAVLNKVFGLKVPTGMTWLGVTLRMESPGFISFKGLGEPIKQLRELLKDFWYRNKQEKLEGAEKLKWNELQRRRAELELEMAEIVVQRLRDLPPVAGARARREDELLIASGLRTIARFQHAGLLRGVDEEADKGSR